MRAYALPVRASLAACLVLSCTATPMSMAAPATCGGCVLEGMVWCYHDNTCYPHGSKPDQQPGACPASAACASRKNCDCSSCADAKCHTPPDAKLCHGWDCTVEGEYCPMGVAGATAPDGDCCINKKWVPRTKSDPKTWCKAPAPSGGGGGGGVTNVEQVHLALGLLPGTLTVSWASNATAGETVLYWAAGSGPTGPKKTAQGDSRPLSIAGSRNTHAATLEGLSAGTGYSYQVGGYARVFNFTFQKNKGAGLPERHVIFGDMGASHAFSLCLACTAGDTVCDYGTCATAPQHVGLVAEVGKADMMLHVGDFAYDLDSDDGRVGDQFMRNIEQLAGTTPYMVSHGNHEDGAGSLAHYVERFRGMPVNSEPPTFTTAAGTAPNNLYFSWDAGLVHYIALSTEFWFGVHDDNATLPTMLAWLEKDLIAANNNRATVPWVVAHGHRSVYCSTSDDSDCGMPGTKRPGDAATVRQDLEPLFFKYGLDFFINGHEHSYERSYPTYKGKSDKSNVDPKATVYMVTGAAGCHEMHEGFSLIAPSWSAFRSNTFGYSVLEAHNATHVHWQQIQTDPTLFPKSDYGRVIDDVWFVQHVHGPFDAAQAPTGTAWPADDETPSRSLDHWEGLLGLQDGSGRATSALIREYRSSHGEEAWARKEDELLRWVNSQMRGPAAGSTVYEDVRADGNSDGAWFKWKNAAHSSVPQKQ